MSRYQADDFLPRHKISRQLIQEIVESPEPPPRPKPVRMKVNRYTSPEHVSLNIFALSRIDSGIFVLRYSRVDLFFPGCYSHLLKATADQCC